MAQAEFWSHDLDLARARHDYVMTRPTEDPVRMWRLQEVADAAWEIPVDEQPPRLREALARLVEVPESVDRERPTRADQRPER